MAGSEPVRIPGKQAVVIIHGMGEQRPMETLRSFVRAIWQSDQGIVEEDGAPIGGMVVPTEKATRSGHPDIETPAGEVGPYPSRHGDDLSGFRRKRAWLAPDTRTGSRELHRMTTGRTVPNNTDGGTAAKNGYRVDFYELYWADLMQGTTLDHLRVWLSGLLFRWPRHVPDHVWTLWLLLWAAFLCVVFLAVVASSELGAALNIPVIQNFDPLSSLSNWKLSDIFGGSGCAAGAITVRAPMAPWGWDCWNSLNLTGKVAQFVLLMAPMLWAIRKLFTIKAQMVKDGDPRVPNLFISSIAALLIGGIGMFLAVYLFAYVLDFTGKMIASAAAIGILAVFNSFLVPYFGDVARYVQARPQNIANRAAVRDRGVRLLRALHDLDGDGKPVDGKKDAPTYGRVVLVGHSLGTIVAMDLLLQFWAEAAPLKKILDGPLKDAVDSVEKEIRKPPDQWDLEAFRTKQKDLMKAMIAGGSGFRITDFVTVGSPLTHSEFLISENEFRFRRLFRERLLAKCPPEDTEGRKEELAYVVAGEGKNEQRSLHHASVFGAVRWTNVFDLREFIGFGDFVSGPVTRLFGKGVKQYRVKIWGKRWWWPSRYRVFTHTQYWNTERSGAIADYDDGRAPARKGDLTHVGVLREAVALQEYASFYPDGAITEPAPMVAENAEQDKKQRPASRKASKKA